MDQVSFKVSNEVSDAIGLACARFHALLKSKNLPKVDGMELHMDLTACHANGCPMDWAKLLGADDFTFAHDVGGIQRHINRTNGKLENCFLPRCAEKFSQ